MTSIGNYTCGLQTLELRIIFFMLKIQIYVFFLHIWAGTQPGGGERGHCPPKAKLLPMNAPPTEGKLRKNGQFWGKNCHFWGKNCHFWGKIVILRQKLSFWGKNCHFEAKIDIFETKIVIFETKIENSLSSLPPPYFMG